MTYFKLKTTYELVDVIIVILCLDYLTQKIFSSSIHFPTKFKMSNVVIYESYSIAHVKTKNSVLFTSVDKSPLLILFLSISWTMSFSKPKLSYLLQILSQ